MSGLETLRTKISLYIESQIYPLTLNSSSLSAEVQTKGYGISRIQLYIKI